MGCYGLRFGVRVRDLGFAVRVSGLGPTMFVFFCSCVRVCLCACDLCLAWCVGFQFVRRKVFEAAGFYGLVHRELPEVGE